MFSLPVGSNDLEIGYELNVEGGGPRGPDSLAALPRGGVCVLDTVNRRLHILASEKAWSADLPFDTYASDVIATKEALHVLHEGSAVAEVSYDGELIRSRPLPSRMTSGDVMRLASQPDDVVVWAGNYHTAVLGEETVADRDAVPDPAEPTEPPPSLPTELERAPMPWSPRVSRAEQPDRGVLGPDGRYWMSELTDHDGGRLVTRDGAVTIPIAVKATFGSAQVIGFDEAGHVFVLVEDVFADPAGTAVEVTVHRYTPAGVLAGMARVPIDECVMHPRHPVEALPDGSLYVLVPREDATTIYQVSPGKPLDAIVPPRRSADAVAIMASSEPRAIGREDFVPVSRLTARDRAVRMSYQYGPEWLWGRRYDFLPDGNYRPGDALRPPQLPELTYADGGRWVAGIPYTWGGFDSPWTHTDWAPWTSWETAREYIQPPPDPLPRGPLIGKWNVGCTPGLTIPCNVSSGAYYKWIAGIDCSGFVAAAAGYFPENAKPGTEALTTTLGYPHDSDFEDGNAVLNAQPMNYFVGASHVLFYVTRDAATGEVVTLEATVSSEPYAAKEYRRTWRWIADNVPHHRAWWPKQTGDSPAVAYTAPGLAACSYGLARQTVWYKITVSGPAKVKLTALSAYCRPTLLIYERVVNAGTQVARYVLHSSSANPGYEPEEAPIRGAGTYWACVRFDAVTNTVGGECQISWAEEPPGNSLTIGMVTGRIYTRADSIAPLSWWQLLSLKRLGIQAIRMEFEDLDGQDPERTEAYKVILRQAAALKIGVIGILGLHSLAVAPLNEPPYAIPATTTDLADFEKRFIDARFLPSFQWHENTYANVDGAGAGVEGWEIWNEPNVYDFKRSEKGPFMGAEFALLCVRVFEKFRTAVGPRKIIIGGLSRMDDTTSLKLVFDSTPMQNFKRENQFTLPCHVLAIHGYGATQWPSRPGYAAGGGTFEDQIKAFLALVDQNGRPLIPVIHPIYMTEIGTGPKHPVNSDKSTDWSTLEYVRQKTQAGEARYVFETLKRYRRFHRAYWYDFRDDERAGEPDPRGAQWYGARCVPQSSCGNGGIKLVWNALANLNGLTGIAQNGPWSGVRAGDEDPPFADTRIKPPGCNALVLPDKLLTAYNRNDTMQNALGFPSTADNGRVHREYNADVQVLSGARYSATGQASLTLEDGAAKAAVVYGRFWDVWQANGGARDLGFAFDRDGKGPDRYRWPGESGEDDGFVQDFRKDGQGQTAALTFETSAGRIDRVFIVLQPILNVWLEAGGVNGLGYPRGNRYSDGTRWRQDFKRGTI